MTLADFETLVFSQQPAVKPWAAVTDYSFEARKAIEGKHPQLIKEVFQPKYVADIGCGPGHLLALLETIGVHGWGLDINPVDTSVMRGDISDGDFLEQGSWFESDLVICREVLEHLTIRQIRQAVMNLCYITSKYVYVTTRFHPHPKNLLDVATSDDLDPTHISMLHQDLLRVLFVLEGFKRRADLEQQLDWQRKGRVLVYERV